MQHSFIKTSIFNGLIATLVVGAHYGFSRLPDRVPSADAVAVVRFDPVALDSEGFAPLTVAGAWRLTASEPRMGGVSALAVDRGGLLVVTDSGVVIRLPKPVATTGLARFHDLPDGPGGDTYKAGRDSEALTRDPGGRGWWVGFENRHAAWLFDRNFTRVVRKIDLDGLGWKANLGTEGAAWGKAGLLLFPERGDEMVEVGQQGIKRLPLRNRFGRVSDVAMLPDGGLAVIARSYSPAGFKAQLLVMNEAQMRLVAPLGLGRLDNPEAIAAEPLAGGGTRLWVMTDNDFRRRVPTLLIALDWRGNAPHR